MNENKNETGFDFGDVDNFDDNEMNGNFDEYFEEYLKRETEKIEVPENLSPENIAYFLESSKNTGARRFIVHKKRTKIVANALVAVAACAAVVAGFGLYGSLNKNTALLDSEIDYQDVSHPDSYGDLYDIYSRIYLNSGGTSSDTEDTLSADSFADDLSDAQLVKTYGDDVYFVGGGLLYKVSGETITACADLKNKTPVEMYIENDKLILVSESAANLNTSEVPAEDADTADTAENVPYSVTADIYDIESSVSYLDSFTQSGSYISSGVFDGNLNIVTDYRADDNTSADSENLNGYVPYYELNGMRMYAQAGDIYVFADAQSTDYTVASSYNIGTGAVSVKAVLGGGEKVFCKEDTLYIISEGVQNLGKPYTSISKFSVGSTIEYIDNGSVEGSVLVSSMDEYNGLLRAAAVNTTDDGEMCTDIYVLDSDLNVVNSAGKLLTGEKVKKVIFSGNTASLYTETDSSPALILNISDNPPTVASDMTDSELSVFMRYNENYIFGCGIVTETIENEDGSETDTNTLRISMFDMSSGKCFDSTAILSGDNISSPSAFRRKSILLNSSAGIIGIPASITDESGVHSMYYLFSFDNANGLTEVGKIEFTDDDDSGNFRKGIISGNKLYIISDARVVAVDISDVEIVKVYNAE